MVRRFSEPGRRPEPGVRGAPRGCGGGGFLIGGSWFYPKRNAWQAACLGSGRLRDAPDLPCYTNSPGTGMHRGARVSIDLQPRVCESFENPNDLEVLALIRNQQVVRSIRIAGSIQSLRNLQRLAVVLGQAPRDDRGGVMA
jgi:hypothetical protein